MDDKILTVPEVAFYLKLSDSKVYAMIQSKKIPHIKIGRNVRIRENDLRKWIEKNMILLPVYIE